MAAAMLIRRLRLRLALRRGHAIKIFIAWLILMMALHVLAMMWIEEMSFLDAIWVTAVTATTVGYGDVSAKTAAGRVATILLMFGGTIFVLAALASAFFDRAAERRSRQDAGKWRWKLHDHLLIISTTGTETPRYLRDLVAQLRRDEGHKNIAIAILTTGFNDGLPEELRQRGVVYFHGDGDTVEELTRACATRAATIVILGESRSPKADAFVYDVATRIRQLGYKGRVVSEIVDDENRGRLCHGPTDGCVRPVRGYPEILARAIISPGAEKVIEEIFTIGGAECECVHLGVASVWSEICRAFIDKDLGIPLAYRDEHGTIYTAPRGSEQVTTREIFIVTQDADQTLQQRVYAMAEQAFSVHTG